MRGSIFHWYAFAFVARAGYVMICGLKAPNPCQGMFLAFLSVR
jgi:hypothetical protein